MTWEYLPVLNSLLQILSTIAIGSVSSFLGIVSETFIQQSVTFVFYVALPSLIIKGIATGIDFYNDENVWPFIVAFLILRFIALILAFLGPIQSLTGMNRMFWKCLMSDVLKTESIRSPRSRERHKTRHRQ